MKKRCILSIFVFLMLGFVVLLSFAGIFADRNLSISVLGEGGAHITDINFVLPGKRYAAMRLFHDGDPEAYLKRQAEKNETDILGALEIVVPGLLGQLEKVTRGEHITPKDAAVDFNPHGKTLFLYLKEAAGRRAEFERAALELPKLLADGGRLQLTYETLYPKVTKEMLAARTVKISEFSTEYGKSAEARKANIELAASFFNGVVVEAGETLSFNGVAKKRTEANGYKVSKVIENGEYTDGVGGGVCQVSTTVYNVWLYAGLEVLESRSHSIPASYVPLCADATVSEYIDLKLLNNSGSDVYILSKTDGSRVKFTLYGMNSGASVRLENKLIKTIDPPEPKREGAGTLLLSSKPGKEGQVYESYQCFYKNGTLYKRNKIRNTYYAPRQGVDTYTEEVLQYSPWEFMF